MRMYVMSMVAERFDSMKVEIDEAVRKVVDEFDYDAFVRTEIDKNVAEMMDQYTKRIRKVVIDQVTEAMKRDLLSA